MDKEKERIVNQYYFKASNPGAYSGPDKRFRTLNKKYPGLFSSREVKQWLNNQDAYPHQKPVRHKFKTPNVRVSFINEQFEADLAYVGNLAKFNDGFQYLLFVIDVLSKYLWIQPLKNKSAITVLEAMRRIINERMPMKLRTDKGSEFVNQWFKKFMKDNNIYFFTTQNVPKASIVERSQRTFKGMLYRLIRQNRSYRYIDSLQELVSNYNSTPHRGLKYLAPKDVNKSNEADVWANMYLKTSKSKSKTSKRKTYRPPVNFKKGQFVRISYQKKPFVKSYMDQFSTEVFKIKTILLKQGIPMYKLEDLKGEEVKGRFYNSELLAVDKDEDSLWYIEKILKKRKRLGKVQYLVKWDGFPKQFNSWVNQDSVKSSSHGTA